MQNARHLMFRPINPDVSSHIYFKSRYTRLKQRYFKQLITDITLVFYFKRIESRLRRTVRNKKNCNCKVQPIIVNHFLGDVGDTVSLQAQTSPLFSAEAEGTKMTYCFRNV